MPNRSTRRNSVKRRLTLSAPAADLAGLTLALPNRVEFDADSRTISGDILPFGVDAPRTSFGRPVRFSAGCLVVPQDIGRVKLLVDHDHSQPVGFALSLDQNSNAARASFRVGNGPAGDLALSQAADRLRDGLSVGIDIIAGHDDGDTYVVDQAAINEVSLCAIPAFSDARVTSVTASHTPTPKDQVPTFNHGPAFSGQQQRSRLTLAAAYDAIANAIQTASSAADIRAALSDVIPTDDAGKGLLPDQLIGEVWQAVHEATPYLDFAFTRKPLTGLKGVGWAWQTRAQVQDYTGNKAAVPSNKPKTKAVEAEAKRLAGGWDVDRVFLDLGDGSMVREIIEQAVADYKDKSNIRARDLLLAGATTISSAGLTLDQLLIQLGSQSVQIGARLDYLSVASDVWTSFAGLTRAEVPWWLDLSEGVNLGADSGSIGKIKLWVDPDLAAGQWIGGDKRAATWWSKEPPVRVQAVDLPRGGVDAGVFGYYAGLVNEPLAVFKGSTTTVPAP